MRTIAVRQVSQWHAVLPMQKRLSFDVTKQSVLLGLYGRSTLDDRGMRRRRAEVRDRARDQIASIDRFEQSTTTPRADTRVVV